MPNAKMPIMMTYKSVVIGLRLWVRRGIIIEKVELQAKWKEHNTSTTKKHQDINSIPQLKMSTSHTKPHRRS